MKFPDLTKQQLGKSQQYGGVHAPFLQVLDDLKYVSRQTFAIGSADDKVTLSIYAEIIGTPILDAVRFDRFLCNCAQLTILQSSTLPMGTQGKNL